MAKMHQSGSLVPDLLMIMMIYHLFSNNLIDTVVNL
jgi:hypothetical protein